ncbi:AraC family transcriptional regulator [Fluviicola sp.]|uniref:helix-turn-helix transcriptional regulator n=1 Tax=Fluviicola sp. TaxID=1917219 RepID=UPI0031DF062C
MEVLTLDKGQYSGNIRQWKEYRGLIASKTAYDSDSNPSFHAHEHPHVSFILQGGNIEYRGAESIVRGANEVTFYHSGELHKTLPATEHTRNLNLEIDSAFLDENRFSEDQLKKAIGKNPDSNLFLLRMQSEIHLNDQLTESALHALLFEFVTGLDVKNYREIHWCVKLHELINDRWAEPFHLNELSVELGVHPVTISKHFARYFGCTLSEYVRKLRIQRSLPLIQSREHSLSEIAFLCGFADQSHFIRVFKHYTGMSPKNYRML